MAVDQQTYRNVAFAGTPSSMRATKHRLILIRHARFASFMGLVWSVAPQGFVINYLA